MLVGFCDEVKEMPMKTLVPAEVHPLHRSARPGAALSPRFPFDLPLELVPEAP